MLVAGARWEVNDDWGFEAAVHSHGSEAVETWDYDWESGYFGSCSAEGDYCRIELVVFECTAVWVVEVCFGRRREGYCRHSVGGWRLLLGEIGAAVPALGDERVLLFVAVAARTSSEQPKRRRPVNGCH